jgi:hypothetical protein
MKQFLLVTAVVGAAAGTARAGELDLAAGLGATTSEWDGDTGASTSVKVGYFFDRAPWIAPILMLRLELVPVDDRMVHYFSVGAEARRRLGPVRGYVRLGLVHCHEESRSAFRDQPLESILGVGDGLRHRGGGNLGVGVEVPIKRYARSDLYLAVDVGGTLFADDRGPQWYASATGGVGFRWGRGAAPASPGPRVANAR